jgi:hypothetical protein
MNVIFGLNIIFGEWTECRAGPGNLDRRISGVSA